MPGILELFDSAPPDQQVGSVALWQAELRAQTFDPDAGEVDLLIYSGAPVDRWSWDDGPYKLTLALDGADLERLNAGGPIQDSHSRERLADQIGAFVPGSVRVEPVGIVGRMRFSSRPDVAWIKQDVANGIIRGVSVGAVIRETEEVRDEQGRLVSVTATSWEAVETSLVSVQADKRARALSMDTDDRPPVTKEPKMSTVTAPAPAPEAPTADELQAIRTAAAKDEQRRQSDIRLTASKLGLAADHETVKACLDNVAVDLHAARARLIDAAEKRDEQTRVFSHVSVGTEDIEHFGNAALKAMQHLAFPGSVDLSGDQRAKVMSARGFIGLAERCLQESGIRTDGMTPLSICERSLSMRGSDVVGLAQSTSDLPALVGNYTRTLIIEGARSEARNFEAFAVQQDLPNMLKGQALVYSGGPRFEKIPEGGNYGAGSLALRNEEYWLSKWGKLLPFTWELMLQSNGFVQFARMARMFGAESVRVEKDVVWGLLTSADTMADGKTLFHADHANIVGTGKVPGTAGFDDMDQLFAAMTDDKGGNLGLAMKTIAGPRSLRTALKQATGQVVGMMPVTAATALPDDMADYTLIIENRLASQVYYGFADPMVAPAVVYGYLEGTTGVDVSERIGFESDGITFKARHCFGAKALDYRGAVKNPGASS